MNAFPDSGALFPLKFTPVYKNRIWGGTQMSDVLHREVPANGGPIGESWEITDRDGFSSIVAEGPLAGVSLQELLQQYRGVFLGTQAPQTDHFPLLVKLIDAGERLSLQVHPDEALCRELGGGAEPKTETWYVLATRPGAKILAGLAEKATRTRFQEMLDLPEIETLLQTYPARPGDAYYIPAGTVHAIGAGNLILEIQQNSDTTMRISDWGRVDAQGRSRELHRETGMRAIHFTTRATPRIPGPVGVSGFSRKYDVVNQCPFFCITELHLLDTWHDDTAGKSFHLLSAVNGSAVVCCAGAKEHPLRILPGETALVPGCCGPYEITPEQPGDTRIVKSTL